MTEEPISETPQSVPGIPEDMPASNLKLTPEREAWMVTLAIDLLKATEKDMGRGAKGITTPGSFLGIRVRNMDTHADNLAWRADDYGGVFNVEGYFRGGFTRGKSREFQRLMSAKLTEDLLGTTPFFGAIATRAGDPKLVKNIEALVQDKIEQAHIPQLLREAVNAALVRNEVIPHCWYDLQVSKFRGPATVAVDPVTKEPIKTPKKALYIYENDDMVPNSAVEGEMILKKDPSFSTRTQLEYIEFPDLEQEQVLWDGLRGALLDNRDFICPTNVNSIHDAKFCARRFDREWGQMREQYRNFDTAEDYFRTTPESAEKSNVQSQGTRQDSRSDLIKWVPVAEIYIRLDADEDGSEEDILLVLDMENEKPIFYDYMRNHMGKRPFEVIVGLRKETNMWAGVGVYSETNHANTFIDLTLNRVNKKDGQGGSATFHQPKACKEWAGGLQPRFGGPESMELNPGFNNADNPPVFRIQLTELSEMSMELSEQAARDMATMVGVTSVATSSALDLSRSNTATGNAIQEREGNLIVKETMKAVKEGIVAFLEQCVEIILEHMDETELFLTKEMELVTLNRDEVRGIEKQVRLLLTKSRSAEGLATSQQAMTTVLAYMDLDPVRRKAVRSFVIDELKIMEVQDPEEKIPEVTPEEIAAWQKSQAQANQPPANASVSVKLTDLTPAERSQVLQKDYGITPSAPEEVASMKAADQARELAQKQAAKPTNVTPMNSAA